MASDKNKTRPLVTFAVLAFQQEKFVAEAVQGAFQQAYQPLEIILSDDCSSDNTFDVMKRLAATYGGPASIKLNRMEQNAGLAAHLNRVVSMARGELIVLAAGDDVSEPERVAQLVARWAQASYSSGSIFSQYLAIEENGNPIAIGGNEVFRTDESWLKTSDRDGNFLLSCPGCTHAFTPDQFKVFGDLGTGVIQEDIYLQLRSSLIGGVGFVNRPLVRYRQTKSSVSRGGFLSALEKRAKMITYLQSILSVYDGYENHCRVAIERKMISLEDYHWAIAKKNEYVESMRNELEYLQSNFGKQIKLVITSRQPARIRARWMLCTLFPAIYGWRSGKLPKVH